MQRLILALLLLAAPAMPALAQRAVVLEKEPLHLPDLGLQVFIPEGAVAEPALTEQATRVTIRVPDQEWVINIQAPPPTPAEARASQIIDEIYQELRKRFGVTRNAIDPDTEKPYEEVVETRARPIERTPNLVIAGRNAERLYVSVADAPNARRWLLGYTVVETTPTEYLIFELQSPLDEITRARAAYETVVASVTFDDTQAKVTERAKRIARGIELMALLDRETFERILADNAERWERLYIPAGTGASSDDTEIGYRRIRAFKGVRGNLDPSKPPSAYDATEQEPGYLVAMDVRILQQDIPVDTRAVYFLSLDGRSEAWTIVMTRRDPTAGAVTFRETGARHETSLKILTESTGQPPRAIRPLFTTEGYLPQVQALLLPQILATLAIPGEYAFYAYRTVDQKVRLREDTLAEVGGRPGVLTLQTLFHEDQPPQVTLLRTDGTVIRTDLPGGRVWEPITLERLVSLWRDKGLPMN